MVESQSLCHRERLRLDEVGQVLGVYIVAFFCSGVLVILVNLFKKTHDLVMT